ncbi:MAG: Sugar efflux transporter for intercellular exchange [Solirubrobacterales bacterium]|nr:Sugar efflux transporter for intercellular exchange [Solirubrobacterales bacterium]
MSANAILASSVGVFGLILAVSPLLQMSRIVRRGSSADVSALQLVVAFIGTSLWCAYGVTRHDDTVVTANGVATLVNAAALLTVLRFRARVPELAPT